VFTVVATEEELSLTLIGWDWDGRRAGCGAVTAAVATVVTAQVGASSDCWCCNGESVALFSNGASTLGAMMM